VRINYKQKAFFGLVVIFFMIGFILANPVEAKEQTKESLIATQDTPGGIRVIISTSGPVEFSSHWLEDPSRLMVTFGSRKVVSDIDSEIIVDQGPIKKITSSYFTGGQTKALKTLTFELSKKVPYTILQRDNAIIFEIQTSSSVSGGEVFTSDNKNEALGERLGAMNIALNKVVKTKNPLESQPVSFQESLDFPGTEAIMAAKEGINESGNIVSKNADTLMTESSKGGANRSWLYILALILSLWFLVWRILKANGKKKLEKLILELEEKNSLLKQEEGARKVIEGVSLQKEKQYEQLENSLNSLKLELEEKDSLLTQEVDTRKSIEEELSRKNREGEELSEKESKEEEPSEEEPSFDEKEESWNDRESDGKRSFPRLPLARDFNKTVILRVESSNLPRNIKCFAKDIGAGGLYFEAKEEFNENEPIVLKLFFYGARVPIMKIKAHVVWKKGEASISSYGVSFDSLEDEDKSEINQFVKTKLEEEVVKVNT